MDAKRSLAYGRVVKTLADMGPAKLQPRERDLVREAADALLFSEDFEQDAHARMAFAALQEMVDRLVESQRWLFPTADQLLRDVEDCGPMLPAELLAPELMAA